MVQDVAMQSGNSRYRPCNDGSGSDPGSRRNRLQTQQERAALAFLREVSFEATTTALSTAVPVAEKEQEDRHQELDENESSLVAFLESEYESFPPSFAGSSTNGQKSTATTKLELWLQRMNTDHERVFLGPSWVASVGGGTKSYARQEEEDLDTTGYETASSTCSSFSSSSTTYYETATTDVVAELPEPTGRANDDDRVIPFAAVCNVGCQRRRLDATEFCRDSDQHCNDGIQAFVETTTRTGKEHNNHHVDDDDDDDDQATLTSATTASTTESRRRDARARRRFAMPPRELSFYEKKSAKKGHRAASSRSSPSVVEPVTWQILAYPEVGDDEDAVGGDKIEPQNRTGNDIRFELQQKDGYVASMTLYNQEVLDTVDAIASQSNVSFQLVLYDNAESGANSDSSGAAADGDGDVDNADDVDDTARATVDVGTDRVLEHLQSLLNGDFVLEDPAGVAPTSESSSDDDDYDHDGIAEGTGFFDDDGAAVANFGIVVVDDGSMNAPGLNSNPRWRQRLRRLLLLPTASSSSSSMIATTTTKTSRPATVVRAFTC